MKIILGLALGLCMSGLSALAVGQERDEWLGGGMIHTIESVSKSAGIITINGRDYPVRQIKSFMPEELGRSGTSTGAVDLASLQPGSAVQVWFNEDRTRIIALRRVVAIERIEREKPR